MKNLKYILIVVLCAFLCSCEDDEYNYKIMTLTVAAQKTEWRPPFGGSDIVLMGYAVTDSDGRRFTIQYIEGFEDKYEEGYIYVIKVKRADRKKPVEDGMSSYYLVKIISKEKA